MRPAYPLWKHWHDGLNVCIYYFSRSQVFDPQGRFLRAFGSQGTGDGKFNYPWGITTDALGFIYVCDKENHRVQVSSDSRAPRSSSAMDADCSGPVCLAKLGGGLCPTVDLCADMMMMVMF